MTEGRACLWARVSPCAAIAALLPAGLMGCSGPEPGVDASARDASMDAEVARDAGVDAEVIEMIDAQMIDAQMIDAEAIDAEAIDAEVIDAQVIDAGVDAERIDSGTDAGMPDGGPPLPDPSTFVCADLPPATGPRMCFDFSDGMAAGWTPEGGEWHVLEGMYVGWGPPTPPPPCGASLLTASLVDGFTASDVRVHVELTAIQRVDKAIILRSSSAGDRIELNFRARFDTTDGADVIVQELVGCTPVGHARGLVPHEVGDTIVVDATLVGTHLTVVVDGVTAIDQSFSFTATTGQVGVALFSSALTAVDSFVAESLD